MGVKWFSDRFTPRPRTVEKDCEICGRKMWLPASKVALYLTCGAACAAKRREAKWREMERPCETCGRIFRPRPVQVTNGGGRYCSGKCNKTSHAAMNSKEAQIKAVAARKITMAVVGYLKGPDSPKWRGGKEAAYQRRKENGTIREMNHRRRVRLSGRVPIEEIERLKAAQKMKCANCKACLVKVGHHIDHIVPISKGGGHEVGNIELLCPSCNWKKHALMPHDWAKKNGRLI